MHEKDDKNRRKTLKLKSILSLSLGLSVKHFKVEQTGIHASTPSGLLPKVFRMERVS